MAGCRPDPPRTRHRAVAARGPWPRPEGGPTRATRGERPCFSLLKSYFLLHSIRIHRIRVRPRHFGAGIELDKKVRLGAHRARRRPEVVFVRHGIAPDAERGLAGGFLDDGAVVGHFSRKSAETRPQVVRRSEERRVG